MPCGGQGRCGRCAVIVEEGKVRRRSTLRLPAQEVEEGWALASQTVIESDLVVTIPPQERIERRIPTAKVVPKSPSPSPTIGARIRPSKSILCPWSLPAWMTIPMISPVLREP